MTPRCKASDAHRRQLDAVGVTREIGVAARAITVGDRGQVDAVLVLDMTPRAAWLTAQLRRVHRFGGMRRSVMTLPAGIVGNAGERLLMAGRAVRLEYR